MGKKRAKLFYFALIMFECNTRKDVYLDSTFTASYVPKEFVQAVKPFFDYAAMIKDFWKSVFLDTKAISHIVEQDTITYTAITAFKQSIKGHKRGKVKTNPVRYYTGIIKTHGPSVFVVTESVPSIPFGVRSLDLQCPPLRPHGGLNWVLVLK